MYPRNPFGRGYLVMPERVDGMELPNLEDPSDLLDDERLITGAPERWYRQPLPWCLDWLHPLMFPRFTHLGADARHPAPLEAMAEIKRGLLARDYREHANPVGFQQEASLGLSIPGLAPGTPVELEGMHPEHRRLAFELPPLPAVVFEVEGALETAVPSISSVVIRPGAGRVSVVYRAHSGALPRVYLPGMHREIPVACRVDGSAAVMCAG